MALIVQCPNCRQRYAAASHLSGKQLPCSNCGATLNVPQMLTRDLDQPTTRNSPVVERRPGPSGGLRAARTSSPASAAVDEIPPWLWWAGGGALGLCVLVFAAILIGSRLKTAEPSNAPATETRVPAEAFVPPAASATPHDVPPTPAATVIEPRAAVPVPPNPIEIPSGVLVYQPQFLWADNSETLQGTGFLVATADRQVVGVSSSHFLDLEGPRLFSASWCDVRDDRPIVRFTHSLGRPGHAGQVEGTIDLRSDYIILVPDQPVTGRPVLELDPRPMPELSERVVLPNKADREPQGYEWREGRVVERDVGYFGVEFETLFPLQSQSGSPLISKATGRVVGTLSRGGERLGRTVILVAPASGILAAIRAGDQRFPLQDVIGK